MRAHLAGCAFGICIGGDEQDTKSPVRWRVTWKNPKYHVSNSCLFKYQNYTRDASRAQGVVSTNEG